MSDVFDIHDWINNVPKVASQKTFEYGGKTIYIQRLNGLEWQEMITAGAKAQFVLLRYGLIDPKKRKTYDQQIIREFCEKRSVAASNIALEIEKFTIETMKAENDMLEASKKNFEATGPSEPLVNGADTTDKTL